MIMVMVTSTTMDYLATDELFSPLLENELLLSRFGNVPDVEDN